MNNMTTKYQELLCHIIQLLLIENDSLRNSMQQIDSLMKHAFELLNENECYVNIALQEKLNAIRSISVNSNATLPTLDHESNEMILRLNKMLSNATQLFQVEDIVSQIVQHVIKRSIEIDDSLKDMDNISLQDKIQTLDDFVQQKIKDIQLLNNSIRQDSIRQTTLHPGEIELF